MKMRITLFAAAVLLGSGAILAQVPVRALRPPVNPNPECANDVRCPDPMTVDTRPLTIASDLSPPDADAFESQRGADLGSGDNSSPYGAYGYTTTPGTTPWMAAIERPIRVPGIDRDLLWNERMYCGGALIAPGWILTAAHCLEDGGASIKELGFRVRLGTSNIRGNGGATYRITAVYRAPNYNPQNGYFHDIALIRFASDSQTSLARATRIQQITIDEPGATRAPLAGRGVYFYGWGRTEENVVSDALLYFKVKIMPDSECANSSIALCAKGIGDRAATQCHGDSGSPMIVFDGSTPVVIGVVSHNTSKARSCGQHTGPGVYTRVAAYRGWIEGRTGIRALN
jgi:secreted trypsin-like serine protease